MKQPYNPLEGDRPELTIDIGDGTDEQFSIIVVHNNRPEFLNMCLQSIGLMSANSNYEVIVVDNNSNKESQDFLDEIKDQVKVVKLETNMHWSAAANRGVVEASPSSKYYVFMHCDVIILQPNWLDILHNVTVKRNVGLVGTEMSHYNLQKQKVDFIEESCMMITKECFKDIGPWPETLPLVGGAFIMTLRANTRGHQPQIMTTKIVHHYKIGDFDVNEWERMAERAMVEIPALMRDIQSVSI